MPKSHDIERKINEAKAMARLEDDPGWKLIAAKIEAMVEMRRDALTNPKLDWESTQKMRHELHILGWLRRSTLLATPEKLAEWQGQLAFQQKQETMRERLGLTPEGKYPEDQR